MDVSDPTRPALLRTVQVGLGIGTVQSYDGLAYVASDSSVVLADPTTGTILDRRDYLLRGISDLAISDGFLYLLSGGAGVGRPIRRPAAALWTDWIPPSLCSRSMTIPHSAGCTFSSRGDSSTSARWTTTPGSRSPAWRSSATTSTASALVGPPSGITAIDVAATGGGLALFARHSFSSAPRPTSACSTSLTPRTRSRGHHLRHPRQCERRGGIGTGLAYVAAGRGPPGRQLPAVRQQKVPPTVGISTSPADVDLLTPGLQVLEGTTCPSG